MLSEEEQKRLARDVRIIANRTRVPAFFYLIVVAAVVGFFLLFCVLKFLMFIFSGFR